MTWHGCGFGLRVAAADEIETLTACPAETPGAPVIWTRLNDRDELGIAWPGAGVSRLVDFRFQDGRAMMSIDTDAGGGFLVDAPGFGTHAVSADGARITSVLPTDAPWEWQRLFIAQALPLAAAMHGLEPMHASAVSIGGLAVAFTAPSNTGKTSIALHLVARGAGLLTDDVLAVESTPSGLLAHPGARLLGAARHELDAVPAGRERLGAVLGSDEKTYLRPELEPGPLPLAALYRLVREPAGNRFRVVEEAPPDPVALLATTFLTYVNAPDRLTRHLDFAARFAQSVRVFIAYLPADLSAVQAAELLDDHIGSIASSNVFQPC